VWKRALHWKTGGLATLLAVFWLDWHLWVARHFAGLASESKPRMLANIIFLMWPFVWPQLAGVSAYTLPILLIFRTKNHDLVVEQAGRHKKEK
jgi:hypothetical protein